MPGLVALADEKVSIEQALRWAGVSAWEGQGGKLDCPFALTSHPDGGADRALRAYPDGMAWCFACGRGWSPVRLMAEYWDCTRAEAAEKMLKLAGITEPSWQERWSELHQPAPPDREALGEALKIWCARMAGPEWDRVQFQPEVSGPLAACLGLLALVSSSGEAETWFYSCKMVMRRFLHGGEGDGDG